MNSYSSRVTAAAALLLFVPLLSSVKLLHETNRLPQNAAGFDGVSTYERRFDGAKKLLPRFGSENLCYLPDPGHMIGDEGPQYIVSQYALVPRVLIPSGQCTFLLTNEPDPKQRRLPAVPRDFVLLEDFGNGVKLYKRESP
ncbi:MAG TPA: hypothetical protein VF493_15565, partial [Terriglobales bacterium]